MDVCTCGHAHEEHVRDGDCLGMVPHDETGGEERCPCIHFEADDEAEDRP